MTHNLLLIGASPFPMHTRDREALGVPRGFRPPSGWWNLRLEDLSDRTLRRLAGATRNCDGRVRPAGSRESRTLWMSVPPESWARFRRRLASGAPPLPAVAGEIRAALGFARGGRDRLRLARRSLPLGARTLILGILNVTPDSFSDGGLFLDPARAAERAFEMVEEGANIVDIGGESTRPGSRTVPARVELRRILPVVERLAGRLPVPLSVDTTKSGVAHAALSAGAEIINDVSGLSFDRQMARVVARHRAAVIISHIRGRPRTMQKNLGYCHLVPEVLAFLRRGLRRAVAAGVGRKSIFIDPGIGFGKSAEQSLLLLRHLRLLHSTGFPILVGASRKSFLGKVLKQQDTPGRLEGSLVAAATAIFNGASALRVHDVSASVRAARIAEAIRDGRL